ncbi:MAG: prolyl oligopeptidase family serine peptidase [Nocardioidaceae bacterium]
MPSVQQPPVAPTQPFEHAEHGVRRPDPYAWMADRSSAALVAHLSAERRWYDSATAHLSSLVATLRAEMTSRVPATDLSVSWRRRDTLYYTRHLAGSDYPQLLRESRPPEAVAPDESEESASPGDGNRGQLLLDANLLADGSGYLDLGYARVSPDQQLLAYAVDRVGDEVFTLRFRDLDSGTDLPDEVPRSYYGGAWSADSSVFFYTVHDEAYRPFQVWRHTVGTPAAADVLVLEEPDERFELNVRGCRSGDLVVLWSGSRDTTEVWVVDAHDPTAPARSVGGRRPGVEYHAEHLRDGDRLLLVTNDGAVEYRLAVAPVPRAADQSSAVWAPLRAEDPAERLERVDAFATHVVLLLRRAGQRLLRVLPVDALDGPGLDVHPAFPTGTIGLGPNLEYDAPSVLVCEQAHVQPPVWSDVGLASGARHERHRQQAPGHDPARYVAESRQARSADGTVVPFTLVRHRDTPLDGTAPALVYGYGAYEYVFEPDWDPALPSLLDRGVVFAHAHVRGGGEGGRRWWLDGRLGHKQHTFDDHLAVADALAGLVDGDRIATRGLSAGGLLQAAVFGQHPRRWRAVVAEVPFVDVVSTMFDASIPLTANEWDEWGDPRRRADFDWMLAYSPYDNLPAAGGRPDLLVTGALHDPRVMVWEPAKWVAALRATDPAWSPRCLFRCEVGAGSHVGPSGRFGHLAYEAEVYAWVLDRLTS